MPIDAVDHLMHAVESASVAARADFVGYLVFSCAGAYSTAELAPRMHEAFDMFSLRAGLSASDDADTIQRKVAAHFERFAVDAHLLRLFEQLVRTLAATEQVDNNTRQAAARRLGLDSGGTLHPSATPTAGTSLRDFVLRGRK